MRSAGCAGVPYHAARRSPIRLFASALPMHRMRANIDGAIFRYVYAGDRVFERTNDAGGALARYGLADASYYGPLLYFKNNDGTHHYPMMDITGTSRRLLSETGAVTDTYSLDAFGRQMSSSGTTVSPYRFGAAWG